MPESSTSLARREAASVVPTPVMTDDEINRTYRLAQMLSESSLFKDVTQAEQAFAKLLLGRDLGLSAAQSLRLYAVEGGIEVPYPLMASFVKNREGYDFTIEWRESSGWVSAKESDGQDVTGCRLTFTVDGEVVGRSTWTAEDSARAELDKPRGQRQTKSLHVKYPRNMFLARAMANGIKWHVPEVAAGHSVYAEGELPRPERFGDDNEDVQGVGWGAVPIPWVAAIKKTMRRAEKLGRSDLADEPAWQMRMVGQTAEVWQRELDEAKAALDLISRSTPGTAVEDDAPDDTPEVETPEGVKRPGEDAVVAEEPGSLTLDDALEGEAP